ncbi:MAG: VanZ family protein [Pigmentiphaga sp.]|nr:VanZ family protein [Pigmentiphaga sp.]
MSLLLRLTFWGALLGVLVLSLISAPDTLPSTGWDKTNHVLGFGVLSFLGYLAYPKRLWGVASGLLLFGIAIEGLQSLRPNRYAEFNDVVADVIGIAVGLLLARLVHPRTR